MREHLAARACAFELCKGGSAGGESQRDGGGAHNGGAARAFMCPRAHVVPALRKASSQVTTAVRPTMPTSTH
eukprot:6197508-Pleurochrysis_carterae.AAC.2